MQEKELLNEILTFIRGFDEKLDSKFEERFAKQDKKIEARFAEQDKKIEARFAEQDKIFDTKLKKLEKEIIVEYKDLKEVAESAERRKTEEIRKANEKLKIHEEKTLEGIDAFKKVLIS